MKRSHSLIAITLFVTVAALLMTFGRNANVHDADSLLTTLMSVQKLTWYYWDQNRFANLLPLLAAPIKDVSANFHFQLFMRNFCAFGSVAFVLLMMAERDRFAERFVFATIVLVLGAPNFGYFGTAIPHAISCFLFGMGLFVLERPQRRIFLACAFALFLAAFFVNISLLIVVIPISFGCVLIARYGQKSVMGRIDTFAIIMAAAAIALVHSSFSEFKTSGALRYSPNGLTIAAKNIIDQLNLQLLLGLLLVSLLAASLTYFRQRRPAEIRIPTVDFLLVVLAIGTIWLLVTLSWVHWNLYAARYFTVNTLILLTVLASWSFTLFREAGLLIVNRQAATITLVSVALFLIGWTSGQPTSRVLFVSGVAGKQSEINQEIPQLLKLIDADKPAVLVGDYRYIVPTAFERMKVTGRPDTYALPTNPGGGHGGPVKDMLRETLPRGDAMTVVCIDTKTEDCFGRLRALGFKSSLSQPIATGAVSAGAYEIFRIAGR